MSRGIFIVPVVVDFVGVCCCLLLEFSLHPILAFVGSSSCFFVSSLQLPARPLLSSSRVGLGLVRCAED